MSKSTPKTKKKPYDQRSDIEKVISNWRKASGLYKRREWSTTIMRSVTSVELAANFVVRKELEEKKGIDKDFVDHLLKWSNGIWGKYDKLILPAHKTSIHLDKFKNLSRKIQTINSERNAIAHSGKFSNETTAKSVMQNSKEIIETFIGAYETSFTLKIK